MHTNTLRAVQLVPLVAKCYCFLTQEEAVVIPELKQVPQSFCGLEVNTMLVDQEQNYLASLQNVIPTFQEVLNGISSIFNVLLEIFCHVIILMQTLVFVTLKIRDLEVLN